MNGIIYKFHSPKLVNLLIVVALAFSMLPFTPKAVEAQSPVRYTSGRLFSPTSFINTRIPANAVYTPETRIGTFRPSYASWQPPVYRVSAGENIPLVKVVNYFSGRTEYWPLPTTALPTTTSDHGFILWHEGTGLTYETWDAKWINSQYMTAGGMKTYPMFGNGISDPPNQRVSASGLSSTAGMIVRENFINPATGRLDPNQPINHALTMFLPETIINDQFVAPAVGAETAGKAGAGGIPMGARFALPPNLDVDSLNVHPFTREVLRAARDYGIYICDRNDSSNYNNKAVGSFRFELGLSQELYGQGHDALMLTVQSQIYNVIQQHGLFRVTAGTGTPPPNSAPALTSNQGTITVNEGQTATNSGTASDANGDPLSFTASTGTVSGNWSWSLPTTDNSAAQTVTITANDGKGGTGQTTFSMTVQNVAPTASFSANRTNLVAGGQVTFSFSNPNDPSSADRNAGFLYSFDCTNDGSFEQSSSQTSYSCTYPTAQTVTARGRIRDKDNGLTDYTISITVTAPTPTATATTATPTATATTVTPTATPTTKTPTPTATTPTATATTVTPTATPTTKTPTPTATTPTATATTPTTVPGTGASMTEFVVLGAEGVWLKSNVQVQSGHVGANAASNTFLANSSEVSLDSGVVFQNSAAHLLGDTIKLGSNVRVSSLSYNGLSGNAGSAQRFSPLSLPLTSLPPAPSVTTNNKSLWVENSASSTIAAGRYRNLTVYSDTTVTFTGGVYEFASWDLRRNVTLIFQAPTEIRISGRLKTTERIYFRPAPGLDATSIRFYALGSNGGSLTATSTSMYFGPNSTLIGNFYAPNGTLNIASGCSCTGAFMGRWVVVDKNSTLTHQNGFGNNTDFAAASRMAVVAPPVAAFTTNLSTGDAPFAVQFTDASTGEISQRQWNFGDGNTSTDQNPSHSFTSAGQYTVTLTVTGAGGSNSKEMVITVTEPLAAAFTPDLLTGEAPLTVTFANASTGDITQYGWDFGDGGTSVEASPAYTFTTPGTYTVTLIVTDADEVENATATITVTEPLVAAFTSDVTSGTAPLTVQFSDASTGAISGYLWDFGDGSTSTDQNPSHIFAEGTYTVTLTVGDADSTASSQTQIVVAAPILPPTAAFGASAIDGIAPLTVQFSDVSTGDISSWAWDFGDGSTSADQHPSHTFNAGQYTVTLTVSGAGGSHSAQAFINVANPPTPPTASIAPSVIDGTAPLTVQFGNQSSGDISSTAWDFGDSGSSGEFSPAYTFYNPGQYTVTLTVSGAGGSHSAQVVINVAAPAPVATPPTANFVPNSTGTALTVQFLDQSGGEITSWAWDFGDGTTSAEISPTHSYAAPGQYVVTLTVTGPGGSHTYQIPVDVQ